MNFLKIKVKYLILAIVFFGIAFFYNYLFAYDEVIVHPSLTQEMAKLYNLNYEDDLTKQEIDLMRKGSTNEDINIGLAARSSNHFFNPLGYSKWADDTAQARIVPEPKLTSKQWAHDSLEQATYPGGDFTWEIAIKDYASGNKERAYEGLGHVLHLIEDAAVPAHVRNDLHISFAVAGYDTGEREPYEDWTRDNARSGNISFDFAEKLSQENKKPIILNSLDGYFDEMAKYTNTRFFSKDTIYTYSEPKNLIAGSETSNEGQIVKYVYGLDENNNKIKLAKILYEGDQKQSIYKISDKTPEIHSDYWSSLAPKSILAGAGVIRLFKQEAEKAAKNYKPTISSKLNKYPYDFTAWMVSNGGAVARNGVTVSLLAGNSVIYSAKQIGALVNNLIASASDKISFSLTPQASGKYTLVFDMSQAIPASSITFFGSVAQIQTAKAVVSTQPQTPQEIVYGAALISQSELETTIEPNKEINLSAQFKNTGPASWQGNKIYLNAYLKNDVANQFYHSSWLTPIRPAKLIEPGVSPDSFGNFNFLIKSPLFAGDYFFKVRPVWQDDAGNFNWIGDKIVSWRIKVRTMDVAQAESEIQDKDKNSENTVDISQGKGQDANTSAKNDIKEENQETPSQKEDKNIAEDNKTENNEAVENKNSQDNANNTEITTPATSPAPFAPFFRRGRDITPPETTIIEKPTLKTSVSTASFKFSSSEDNSTFLCGLDNAGFISCGANKTYENLSDGGHNLKVKAVDVFNNVDETPAEFSWTIDTIAPVKIVNLVAAPGASRGKIKLNWTRPEENVSYEIRYAEEKEIVETGAAGNQINWQDAAQILEAVDNNAEQIEIGNLTFFVLGKTYYFAIKSKDELNNISEISNSASSAVNAEVNHIVISEIQIAGVTADDEFIELYNPTEQEIVLTGYKINKKTSGGGENTLVVNARFTDKTIKRHGYLLLGRTNHYQGSVSLDISWPESDGYRLADDNTIILYGQTQEVIDKAGWGDAIDFEGTVFPKNPPAGQSLERKANYSSSDTSMSVGADKYLGNGWDSDNNSTDFVLQTAPNPQNSQSPIEPRYAPEKINNFVAAGTAGDSHAVKLTWAAPYGAFGNPQNLSYDIRYSTAEINSQNFNSASLAPSIPLVGAAGAPQELIIGNLSLGQTYYFAIKTKDDTGLESEISFTSYTFPAPDIQVFVQNLVMTYFASTTNNGSDNYWPQVSQTIGSGFNQTPAKVTINIYCNPLPALSTCDISYKTLMVSMYSDANYTEQVAGGFLLTGYLGDPMYQIIPAGSNEDVAFKFPAILAFTFQPKYYYKITFQFNILGSAIQWGGSSSDSYANGYSTPDYSGGADLYFKLSAE